MAAVELGQTAGISVEGEIGFVGYDEGASSQGTDPEEARQLAQESGLHALAISAGNTHLQTHAKAQINVPLIEDIAAKVDVPLVLHGGSGIPADMRHHLARRQLVQKFNIGTEIRQVFGQSLRSFLTDNPTEFDRLTILKSAHQPMRDITASILTTLSQGPDITHSD